MFAGWRVAREGIEAEVIDLRSLRPLDTDTIAASVARTRRAVVIDEGWRSGSLSAEVAARVAAGQVNVVTETTSRTTQEIIRANMVTVLCSYPFCLTNFL